MNPPKQQNKRKSNPVPKRKQNKPPKNGSLKNTIRTPGSIIATFSSQRSVSRPLSHYVKCRSDPFRGSGAAAIPDGSNSNFMVVDAFMVDTITAPGSSFVFQTIPTLPALGMIASLSTLVVNGNSVGPVADLQPGSTPNHQWYPMCIPTPYAISTLPGIVINDPYSAVTARMISVGYRIIYTGPATTCSGSITVTPNSMGLELVGTTTTNATTGVTLSTTKADNSLGSAIAGGTPVLNAEISINSSALTRASVTVRPEQGLYLLPTHRSTNHKVQPTVITPYAVLAGSSPTSTGASRHLLKQSNGIDFGVIWYDTDWSGFQVAFNGINSDASYRIESVLCMEYNPSVSSTFYPLTMKSSPPLSTPQLTQAQNLVEKGGVKTNEQ